MSIAKFNNIRTLSNIEISEAIIKTEKELFDLRFKKSIRQSFKSSDIKNAKCKLAQLKTLLTLRLNQIEDKQSSKAQSIIINFE